MIPKASVWALDGSELMAKYIVFVTLHSLGWRVIA